MCYPLGFLNRGYGERPINQVSRVCLYCVRRLLRREQIVCTYKCEKTTQKWSGRQSHTYSKRGTPFIVLCALTLLSCSFPSTCTDIDSWLHLVLYRLCCATVSFRPWKVEMFVPIIFPKKYIGAGGNGASSTHKICAKCVVRKRTLCIGAVREGQQPRKLSVRKMKKHFAVRVSINSLRQTFRVRYWCRSVCMCGFHSYV